MAQTDNRPRLSDIAQEEILCRIRSGELPIGTRLPSEPDLARQMGISRGILREALNALQVRGFITRTPRGGSHICDQTTAELTERLIRGMMQASLSDLIDYREALEGFAARRVLQIITDEELVRLRNLIQFDAEHVVVRCHDFHYRIAELSGVQVFAQYIDFYFERLPSLILPELKNIKPKTLERDHERIFSALENRSLRQLNAALRRQFKNIRKFYQV